MTINNLIDIFFLVIVLIFVISQIRSSSQGNKPSKKVIILDAIIIAIPFLASREIPDEIGNTKLKYLDGKVSIEAPSTADDSALSIESFQVTGDSTKGIAYVKLHVTSNFYLLNGSITINRGEGLEPVTVGYNIPSSTCLSTSSGENFGIRFEEMKSGETYTAEAVAEDISGNKITETIEFVAY